MSWEKFQERGLETLVNMKAILLITVSGKIVGRVESAYSVPTVMRGTVPLARIRIALTDLM